MPERSSYPAAYIDATRDRIDHQVAVWRETSVDADLEHEYFAALLLGLELAFVHRARPAGSEGGPLDEVRVIAAAILEDGAVLSEQAAAAIDPRHSMLGLAAGAEIALDVDAFLRLSDAFLLEIDKHVREG